MEERLQLTVEDTDYGDVSNIFFELAVSLIASCYSVLHCSNKKLELVEHGSP